MSEIAVNEISTKDWRPEIARIFAIIIVIWFHFEFYTGNLVSELANPLIMLGGVAIGVFMITSGYVHGLKDEFNKQGLLNKSSYQTFLRKRLSKLYIGYYLALLIVLIGKLFSGHTIDFSTTAPITFYYRNPIPITPASLVLELTCTWPLVTGNSGGIWPEGWFISAMIIISFAYPLLRRIHSINKNYLFAIIVGTMIVRGLTIAFINPNFAYYFPFAWTAEFSVGMIFGDYVRKSPNRQPQRFDSFKPIVLSIGARVWPLYLVHIAAVVFMPHTVSFVDALICIGTILILAEICYQILKFIYNRIFAGLKQNLTIPTQMY